METRIGVCNLCEAICGLQLGVDGDRVVSVRGNPEDPLSRGHICPKALALPDIHADPDRLTGPVRRTAHGWQEISWDDAFDEVATRFAGVQRARGRDALAVYLGNPNVHSLGALTHGPVLLRQLATRNRYSATSVDQLPHQLVAWLLYGHQLLLPVPDIDRTDYLLLFGSNPMASNGSLMTVPDFPGRLRELMARGGRLVVFDPRRTETARVATAHHFIRPGTDAIVLLAMARTILADGLGSGLGDLAGYVDGLDDVRAAIEAFTPEAAADASGVPADIIRAVAADLAAAKAAAVHGRVGLSTQRFGTVCQWAVQLLSIITGNLDRPGGAMFTHPAIDVVGRRLAGRGHLGRWHSRVRGLPEFAGELPVATLADEILTPGEGQVRAVLTVAGNPVLSTPNGARLAEAFDGLEFMAAIDYYVNETTRHAHVILPPTGALERDHYDLVFHLLAVRDTARFTPAVLDPAPGARHDWEIYRELGIRHQRAMGSSAEKGTVAAVKARLVREARLRTSPTRLVGLLLATGRTGVTLRGLRANPAGVDLGPLRPSLPDRLQTKDQRIDLAPPVVLNDLPRLRDELLGDGRPASIAGVPLQLIGRRHQRDCNSWMHNTTRLTKGRRRHQLLMHPDDLAARGLIDGQQVALTSRVGRVEVDVLASADMMPGVVCLPHGYGHGPDGVLLANAVTVPGVSINDLTDPEEIDELSGNAAFSGLPVTVGTIDATGC